LVKAREDILGKVDLKKEAAGLGFGIVGGADTSLVGRKRRLLLLAFFLSLHYFTQPKVYRMQGCCNRE
jgi:hypothetical protein